MRGGGCIEKKFGMIAILLFVLFLSGCSSILGWDTRFKCPKPGIGKCESLEDAYKESTDRYFAGFDSIVFPGVQSDKGNLKKDVDYYIKKLKECKPRDDVCKRKYMEMIRKLTHKKNMLLKQSASNLYIQEKVKVMSKLMKNPPFPLRFPPKIVRVYIAPYVDPHNRLVMGHYVYLTVNEGKWIFDPRLLSPDRAIPQMPFFKNKRK